MPFYIAAPSSTIDPHCPSGDTIPIEERDEDEVLCMAGKRVAPRGAHAANPAFDVTPAQYITGIITEEGIWRPATGVTMNVASRVRRDSAIARGNGLRR